MSRLAQAQWARETAEAIQLVSDHLMALGLAAQEARAPQAPQAPQAAQAAPPRTPQAAQAPQAAPPRESREAREARESLEAWDLAKALDLAADLSWQAWHSDRPNRDLIRQILAADKQTVADTDYANLVQQGRA